MGLAKNIESNSGADASYFKITRVIAYNDSNILEVMISSYVSQELADQGKSPLDQIIVTIQDPDLYHSVMTGSHGVVKEIENAILASNPNINPDVVVMFASASQVDDTAPSA